MAEKTVAQLDAVHAGADGVRYIKGHYVGTGGDIVLPLPGMEPSLKTGFGGPKILIIKEKTHG